MKYRKLRIAFSAVCGVLCLLLILLWVRSYWWLDSLDGRLIHPSRVQLKSREGQLQYTAAPIPAKWELRSRRLSELDPELLEIIRKQGLLWRWRHQLWRWGRDDFRGITKLYFPHWFVVVAFVVLGTIPWLHRTSLRFSLRALLIATTLVAILLGLIVYAAS
jgi:hypothetical protein